MSARSHGVDLERRVGGPVVAIAVLSLVVAALSACAPPARPPDLSCELIPGVVGAEDIELDGNRLIISAQDRVGGSDAACGCEHLQRPAGGLYELPLDDGEIRELERSGDGPAVLHPHGISLVSAADGSRILHVIHHGAADDEERNHGIEIYKVAGQKLVHQESVTLSGSRKPNDLVATPKGRVYVSRPSDLRAKPMAYVRGDSRALDWMRSDGRWFTTGDDLRFVYANGVAHDEKRGRLFVADTVRQKIRVLELDDAGKPVLELDSIAIGSGVDNLTWSADRQTLYAAAHRSNARFIRHGCDVERRSPVPRPSPSEVYAIHLDKGRPSVERIFYDSGERISGASVAVVAGHDLYLGQVFGDGIWKCRLQPAGPRKTERRRIAESEVSRVTDGGTADEPNEDANGVGSSATTDRARNGAGSGARAAAATVAGESGGGGGDGGEDEGSNEGQATDAGGTPQEARG